MQVIETKKDGLKREFKITVDAATLEQQMEQQLKNLSGKLKLPGFRPGHVPMNIMRQRYGASVQAEVLEKQVQESSQQVMKDKNLRPASAPKVDVQDYKENGELVFTMAVEVLPEISAIDYGKIALERSVAEVDEKDVSEGIDRLAKGNKQLKPKEKGKAETGDVLTIDFVGKIDGVAFEGGTANKVKLEIDSHHFIPGFEEQLKGVKEGDEKQVKVTFPADYFKKDLAGKEAVFDVKVHDISTQEAPEINDEFAKNVGFDSLEKLKEAVRKQFEGDYAQMSRSRLKKQLFDWLENNTDFEVPESMLTAEFDAIWKQIENAKKQGDTSEFEGKSDDELKKEYKAIAARRVRLGLILSEVSLQNKLNVTRDELAKAMTEQARQFPGQEQMLYEYYKKNPGHLENLRGPILEDKAVDFILSKAKVSDKKIAVADLLKEETDDASSGSDEGTKKTSKKKK